MPRTRGALTLRRVLGGFALTVVGLPLLTWLLATLRTPDSLVADVLAFQLFIVIVALVGGLWPALTAALKAANKPVQFHINENYNHFEMMETFASPYGLLGRCVLEQMQLRST